MNPQIKIVGIGWYCRQDYPAILHVMEDADNLPATYDRWLRAAETGEREMKKAGITVVRAEIAPYKFKGWCESLGLARNADARMRWANERAYMQTTGAAGH